MTNGPAPLVGLEERLRRAGADAASALGALDVTSAVLVAVSATPTPRRRWPTVAAIIAVLAGSTTLAIPSARAGVARWLGVTGGVIDVRIEPFPADLPAPLPAEPASPPGAQLFGEPVTASAATALTGLRVPAPALLGPPDAVYVDATGHRIIAVYGPTAELPAGEVDGVGAIIEVIRGSLDRGLYVKSIGLGDVVDTEVDGVPALFIDAAHPLSYRDDGGAPVTETARLAGRTLLWSVDGIVHRLESSLDLEGAVAVAESML